MAQHTFDLVVLGGGSAGYAAAIRGIELGMSVALIEKNKVGGTWLVDDFKQEAHRFSALPPYASVRVFDRVQRKLWIR